MWNGILNRVGRRWPWEVTFSWHLARRGHRSQERDGWGEAWKVEAQRRLEAGVRTRPWKTCRGRGLGTAGGH